MHRSLSLPLIVVLLALCAPAARVAAQQPGPPPPGEIDPRRATREMQQREADLRSAGRVVTGSTDPRVVRASVEQVKDDFEHLQVLRNELVEELKASGPHDYRALAKTSDEIQKCANRLKAALVLYGTDAKDPEKPLEIDAAHFDRAAVALCKTIDRFVENPVFNLQGVVDVKQSTQAGGDLLVIIQLSSALRKVVSSQ